MKFAQSVLTVALLLALSANVYAMESMGDDSMADTTGQVGISIYMDLNVSNSTFSYKDPDGLANADSTDANSSAMVKAYSPAFNGFSGTGDGADLNVRDLTVFSSTIQAGSGYTNASGNAAPMLTTIDVGANSSHEAVVNLNISIPQLNISFTGIDVCSSTVSAGVAPCTSGFSVVKAPSSMDLVIQNLTLNFQLGYAALGHLALVSGGSTPMSMALGTAGGTNKVVIADPNNTNGGIGLGLLSVTGLDLGDGSTAAKSTYIDACSSTVSANCSSSDAPGGLLISFGSSTMGNVGVFMQNVTFGDTGASTPSPSIGNITLTSLGMGGASVRIVGH